MLIYNRLAFKIPLAAAGLMLLGGCYTVLKHPGTELTSRHADYSDCASCHTEGFDQPLISDPYVYVNDWYWSYYGCPWWLPECGYGLAYGDGAVQEGSGGFSDVGRRGRFSGSRGNPASGFTNTPPPIRSPGGVGSAAPGSVVEPGDAPDAEGGNDNSNRTAKPGRKSDDGTGTDGSKDKTKEDPQKDKTKDKDKPQDKP